MDVLVAGWADSVREPGHGLCSKPVGEVEVAVDIVLVARDECEVDVVPRQRVRVYRRRSPLKGHAGHLADRYDDR